MSTLPSNLKNIALFLERLPGIGEKTANRLAFYLLRMPDEDLKEFGRHLADLKSKTKFCKLCMNLTEEELCSICSDEKRDFETVTVVETVLDILSFETGNIYQGVYHVLHGKIDPLNNIGPDDIFIEKLIERVRGSGTKIKEIILATNPDMEGEATAMFIRNKFGELMKADSKLNFKISRLGYGLPMGGNLEYADYGTLRKAIENRNKF